MTAVGRNCALSPPSPVGRLFPGRPRIARERRKLHIRYIILRAIFIFRLRGGHRVRSGAPDPLAPFWMASLNTINIGRIERGIVVIGCALDVVRGALACIKRGHREKGWAHSSTKVPANHTRWIFAGSAYFALFSLTHLIMILAMCLIRIGFRKLC